MEKLTYISTELQRDTVPSPKYGAKSQLGNWMAPEDMDNELNMRFPDCMKGEHTFLQFFFSLLQGLDWWLIAKTSLALNKFT